MLTFSLGQVSVTCFREVILSATLLNNLVRKKKEKQNKTKEDYSDQNFKALSVENASKFSNFVKYLLEVIQYEDKVIAKPPILKAMFCGNFAEVVCDRVSALI